MDKMHREYQSAVDNLTAKLITTEEALMTQREEFMQMRGRWKEMKAENETVPVLKAQVNISSLYLCTRVLSRIFVEQLT